MNNPTFSKLSRVISIFVLLAVFVAAFPAPVQAAPEAADCDRYHRVRYGQTVKKVAKLYGMDWQEIVKANNLTDPYTLTVGQRLCIPVVKKSSSTSDTKATFSAIVTKDKDVQITLNSNKKSQTFFVRVGPNVANNRIWYKVGKISSKTSGTTTRSFDIPTKLTRHGSLQVCLKNTVTDSVVCATVLMR